MSEKKRIKVPLSLLSFIGGGISALPIVFPKLFFIGIVSFALPGFVEYTASDKKLRFRSAYARGLSFFFGFGCVMFSWFTSMYPLDFAGLTKPAALAVVCLGWFGLSFLQALFMGLVFLLMSVVSKKTYLKDHSVLYPLTFALVYTVFEWMSTKTWAAVPWGRLAVGQAEFLPMIQIASVVGSYGVTFILVFFGISLGVSVCKYRMEKDIISFRPILVAGVILISNIIFGTVRLASYTVPDDAVKIDVAALQGNMSSTEKWSSDSLEESYEIYERLTAEATGVGADLVLLPETAIIYNLDGPYGSELKSYFSRLAREYDCVVVTGAFTRNDEGVSENSVVAFYPNGEMSREKYIKRHLVPFGEYVPMRDFITAIFPPLSDVGMLESDLAAGCDAALIETEYGCVAPLICFDSIYETLALDSVRAGGELIVLSTNDSWFLDSHGVWEHNRQAVLRGVECGRYVVRSANTGVSSVISPTGKILDILPPLEEGFASAEVYMIRENTPYTVIGNSFIAVCVIGTAVTALYSVLSKRRDTDESNN